MLATRQKVLANVKPYHRDTFAFNFVRAILAKNSICLSRKCYYLMMDDLNMQTIMTLLGENFFSNDFLPQIGWLLLAYYKIALLKNKTRKIEDNEKVSFLNIRDREISSYETCEIPNPSIIFIDIINKYKPDTFLKESVAPYAKQYSSLIRIPDFNLPVLDYITLLKTNSEIDPTYEKLLMDCYDDLEFSDVFKEYRNFIDGIVPLDVVNNCSLFKSFDYLVWVVVEKLRLYHNITLTSDLLLKSRINLPEVLPIFMFSDFFERGIMSFDKYDDSHAHKIANREILSVEEFRQIKFTTIPFDTTKSFYEVIEKFCDAYNNRYRNYKPDIWDLKNERKQIKKFVSSSYVPLHNQTNAKIKQSSLGS